jgi:carbamoyl-phosphate synthase, small subunit
MKNTPSLLVLENGERYPGYSFGSLQASQGEVVFNTAMVGYPESLTDPSYSGQILCSTYPLIGNYGVPKNTKEGNISLFFESNKIHVRGFVVSDYSARYSHWNAEKSLDAWLKEHQIPGIFGIDTRALTQSLRDNGALLGKIIPEARMEDALPDGLFENPNTVNQVAVVSCKEVIEHPGSGKRVVLIDCGVKNNILRCLIQRDVHLIQVPWDYDFSHLDYDGIFVSNGPGNPEHCSATVAHLRQALGQDKPIFGICMGNQLLAKAAGAQTFKLKYGHRSHNQPVMKVGTQRCYITSQNHGYAVDNNSLPSDWEPLFVNMNDGTNEGIRHKNKPFYSAQFHPEAASGPTDTEFLFDDFIKALHV